jgi:hypothetical protein
MDALDDGNAYAAFAPGKTAWAKAWRDLKGGCDARSTPAPPAIAAAVTERCP